MATKLYDDDDDSLDFDKKSRKSAAVPKLSGLGEGEKAAVESVAPRPKLYSTSTNSSDYYKETQKKTTSSVSAKDRRSYSPVSRSPSARNRSPQRDRTPSRSPSRSRSRSRSRITRSPSPVSRSISRESTGSVKNQKSKRTPQTPPPRNAAVIKPRTTYQLKYNGSLNGSKKALNGSDPHHKGSSQSLAGSAPRANKAGSTRSDLVGKVSRGSQKIPVVEPASKTAMRVMSAQRLKNNDLRNKIGEMTLEIEKLKEENRTLKRVHQREETALKKFESHEIDVGRLVRNHSEELSALKEILKKVKAENRKLNGSMIDKDEELRSAKKRNEELKKIINDKKLGESVELTKKLEAAEKSLKEAKSQVESLERKLELVEKNHKHEIGVEMAHQRETQKNLLKATEELKELKVKYEEKERALDMLNIYSRQIRNDSNMGQPGWKTSTQSLNSSMQDLNLADKRKDYGRKRRDTRGQKGSNEDVILHLPPQRPSNHQQDGGDELDAKRMREDAEAKKYEIEMKIKQQEEELKRKDAAERSRRLQIEEEEKQRMKMKMIEEDEEEKARLARAKELLEEEDRKKRWIISNENLLRDNKDPNAVDQAKKEELLAKLSLKKTEPEMSRNNNNISSFGDDQAPSNYSSSRINESAMTSEADQSQLFKPQKLPQQNPIFMTDYRFPPQVENLHEGKPSNSARDDVVSKNSSHGQPQDPKSELLAKLFGPNMTNLNDKTVYSTFSDNNSSKTSSSAATGNKFNPLPDQKPFKSMPAENNTNPNASKVTFMPWEIQDVNMSSNTNKSQSKSNGFSGDKEFFSKADFDRRNSGGASDLLAKLNMNGGQKDVRASNNGAKANMNGINRPKIDNKLIFSNHLNYQPSYVEDIEELTL